MTEPARDAAADGVPAQPASPTSVGRSRPGTGSDVVGRMGLFVGGWFALGAVHAGYATAASWLVGFGVDAPQDLPPAELAPAAVVAVVFAAGLLAITAVTKGRPAEPLGVISASGSIPYVGLATGLGLYSGGVEGNLLFWLVVGTVSASSVALLLWVPHPFLGVNAALATTVGVVALPIGSGAGPAAVTVLKALLLGFALVSLAFVVEVRSRSRAGSVLHYGAVAAFAVAEVVSYHRFGPAPGAAILLELGILALLFGLVARRRSWSFLGWLTLEFCLFALLRALFGLDLDLTSLGIAAIGLIGLALTAQRYQHRLRSALLSGLPAGVRDALDV
jgi:hypothetical protein